jgi:hypothetical protein
LDVTVFPVRAAHLDAVIERGTIWRLSFMLVLPSGSVVTAAELVAGDHVVTGPGSIDVVHSVTAIDGSVQVRFGQGQWWEGAVIVKADAMFETAAPVVPVTVTAAYEYDYPVVVAADGTTSGGPIVTTMATVINEDGSVTVELPAVATWTLPADVGVWDMTFTLDTGDTVRVLEGQFASIPTVSGASTTVPVGAPTLSSLVPSTSPIDTPNTMEAIGAGFVDGSLIHVGDVSIPTTYGSPSSLIADITGTAGEGIYLVHVRNPDGQVSNEIEFSLVAPAGMVYNLTAQNQPPDAPGEMCFRSAQWSANPLWIALVDANGQNNTAVLAAIASGTYIRFTDTGDSTCWQEYLAVEAAVVGADYVTIDNPVHMNAGTNITLPATVVVEITPPARRLPRW